MMLNAGTSGHPQACFLPVHRWGDGQVSGVSSYLAARGLQCFSRTSSCLSHQQQPLQRKG